MARIAYICHVHETVRNRNSPPAILLREGWREGKKVRKRTLANLSHLPKNIIELIRRALKGEAFVAVTKHLRSSSPRFTATSNASYDDETPSFRQIAEAMP